MFCKHCGKSIDQDAKFCTYCGKPVSEDREIVSPQIKVKEPGSNGISRKQIIIGVIAGLVLTAVCSPVVLIARSQVMDSLLNPQNRSGSIWDMPDTEGDQTAVDSAQTESISPDPTQESPENEVQETPESLPEIEAQPTAQDTPTPEEIQVTLHNGNALDFSQPPDLIVYADDQAGSVPSQVQLAPFCQTGCFRYNGWLAIMKPGDSYDVKFTEPTSSVGVQFWGDPGDGIAHVYLDGELVWEGSTEGTDANYPGGAFVNYLQISNLPEIANHILRIETDAAGGAVSMYFFGSGLAIP